MKLIFVISTSNGQEAFHDAHYNEQFYSTHPTIFYLFEEYHCIVRTDNKS